MQHKMRQWTPSILQRFEVVLGQQQDIGRTLHNLCIQQNKPECGYLTIRDTQTLDS